MQSTVKADTAAGREGTDAVISCHALPQHQQPCGCLDHPRMKFMDSCRPTATPTRPYGAVRMAQQASRKRSRKVPVLPLLLQDTTAACCTNAAAFLKGFWIAGCPTAAAPVPSVLYSCLLPLFNSHPGVDTKAGLARWWPCISGHYCCRPWRC